MKNNQENIAMTTKDFLVTGESFDLIFDSEKQMLRTSPQPKTEDLSKYYDSEAYISHTDQSKGIISSIYQLVKKYSLARKLKLITYLNSEAGTLLDIGAGTGEFLKLAQENKWKIQGAEPNQKAINSAINKGITLKESIDDHKGNIFDVVTLWHALEHLPDLETTIKKIEDLVKPGGSLIIAVPNFNSFDAKYYKNHWAGYDVPRHLWHFSKKSMKLLFSSDMKLERIKPLIFDSFYVSLLSEKYKKGNVIFLKAFLVGLWSNLSALNSKESSSLIYCFRKANQAK